MLFLQTLTELLLPVEKVLLLVIIVVKGAETVRVFVVPVVRLLVRVLVQTFQSIPFEPETRDVVGPNFNMQQPCC